ncbi:hypothetical protein GF377_02635, partial [candidate division GN15 bacterium]|nr:hypothetical protein [candidate division GN15 bacterium]
MCRRRSLPGLLILTLLLSVLLSFSATAEETERDIRTLNNQVLDPLWAPTLDLPNDTFFVWCSADTICYEISGVDPDSTDTLTLTLLEGPIDIEPRVFPFEFTTSVCFAPEQPGPYTFVWQLTDKQEHVVTDTVTFTLEVGLPPVIEDQSFFAELCDLRQPRMLPLVVDGSDVEWEIINGPGTIDPGTGVLTYQPDTSGTFQFTVAVSNICGADTAVITDQIVLNLPPYCLPYDTTVELCAPEQICFDIFAQDPEGDPITIELLEGIGSFEQTSDTSGTTCFTPADQAYAVYNFIFFTADSCVLAQEPDRSLNPDCCVDTVTVEVIITQPGELACPGDTSISLCVPPGQLPEEVCIPGVMSTWENTEVSFGSLSGDTLCFTPNELGTYGFTVVGSDTCGNADTCMFSVTLVGNEAPTVTADDFTAEFCQSDFFCFPVSAFDTDGEIVDITTSLGSYEADSGMVCFFADTAGTYEIEVTATDDCGATAVTTATAILEPVAPPTVDLGPDQNFFFCEQTEVCIDVALTGERIESVMPSIGQYNEETGQLCFVPEASGVYTLIVEVYDDCNNMAADTVDITLALNNPPIVAGPNDTSLVLCQPGE